MCFFQLPICPYPHVDEVTKLMFDPCQRQNWTQCETPKPWGRLSCGNLVVEHPLPAHPVENTESPADTRSQTTDDAAHPVARTITNRSSKGVAFSTTPCSSMKQCQWCSLTLKINTTKARFLHKDAVVALALLEQEMDNSDTVREIQNKIAIKEAELNSLKRRAWEERFLLQEKDGKDEQIKPESICMPKITVSDDVYE